MKRFNLICIFILSTILFSCYRAPASSPFDKFTGLWNVDRNDVDPLVLEYGDIPVSDVHNHDAIWIWYPTLERRRSFKIWEKYNVGKVMLCGSISCPEAVRTDWFSFRLYRRHPDLFYPFFAGFDINDETCLEVVKKNFEKGYFGVGEFVAASDFGAYTSHLEWRGKHPMDGYFPEVYELCAEYNAPILLHIDPLGGVATDRLEEAMDLFPDTVFILGHANVYSDPSYLDKLMRKHPNLYVDIYAGFDEFHSGSWHEVVDYTPLAEKYPDRVLVCSDSGCEIGYEDSYIAIYRFLAALDRDTAEMVAYRNFQRLMDAQPATEYQLARMEEICRRRRIITDVSGFSKQEANEFIFSRGRR